MITISPEIQSKIEEAKTAFYRGNLIRALNLVIKMDDGLNEIIPKIKGRFDEILDWNLNGKPSSWVHPVSWGQMPKFSLAHHIIQRYFKDKKVKMLDIGCFTGYFTRAMMIKDYDAYGCDIQKQLMEELSKKFPGKFAFTRAEHVDQEFKGEEFDAITMFDVLEHLIDDKGALKAADTILKPTGMLIINVPMGELYTDDSYEHMRIYWYEKMKELVPGIKFHKCEDEQGRPTIFGIKIK